MNYGRVLKSIVFFLIIFIPTLTLASTSGVSFDVSGIQNQTVVSSHDLTNTPIATLATKGNVASVARDVVTSIPAQTASVFSSIINFFGGLFSSPKVPAVPAPVLVQQKTQVTPSTPVAIVTNLPSNTSPKTSPQPIKISSPHSTGSGQAIINQYISNNSIGVSETELNSKLSALQLTLQNEINGSRGGVISFGGLFNSPSQNDIQNVENQITTINNSIGDINNSITTIQNNSGGGTVTSVDASGGSTGLIFTGGPVTSTGTLTLSGTLGIANGGTGITSPIAAGVVVGNYAGTGYQQLATSSLGLTNSVFGRTGSVTAQSGDYNTSQVTEGSNLYYTPTRVAAIIAGTTTDALAQGTTNKYYADSLARAAISSSATGLTYTQASGIFSLDPNYNIPLNASTTAWNNFTTTPSSVITAGTNLTWTGNTLNVTGLSSASSTLLTDNNTFAGTNYFKNTLSIASSTPSGNYGLNVGTSTYISGTLRVDGASTFANSFGFDSTYNFSHPTSFTIAANVSGGRFSVYNGASEKFFVSGGDGSVNSIGFFDITNGSYYLKPANTTTSLLVAGNVGIGTTSPYAKLSVAGTGVFQNIISTSTTNVNGIATSSPSANYGFDVGTSTYVHGSLTVDGAQTSLGSFVFGTAGVWSYSQGNLQMNGNTLLQTKGSIVLDPNNGNTGGYLVGDSDNGVGALRNSSNAQTFRVYNTYTNASNYERGTFGWSGNTLNIGTENAGTGSARALAFLTGSTTRMTIDSTGVVAIASTTPSANYGFNIGSSTLAGSITSTGNLTLAGLTSGSVLFSGTGGVLSQDNSNFYWDSNNHRLGIGTASPGNPLSIVSTGNSRPILLTNNTSTGYDELAFSLNGALAGFGKNGATSSNGSGGPNPNNAAYFFNDTGDFAFRTGGTIQFINGPFGTTPNSTISSLGITSSAINTGSTTEVNSIATSSPSANYGFDIGTTTFMNGLLTFASSSANTNGIAFGPNNFYQDSSSGFNMSNNLTIDSSESGSNNTGQLTLGGSGGKVVISVAGANSSITTATNFIFSSNLVVNNQTTNRVAATIKGVTGQTSDLLNIDNVSGTVFLGVAANGNVGIASSTPGFALTVGGPAVFNSILSTSTVDLNGIGTSSPSLNYGFSIATSTYISSSLNVTGTISSPGAGSLSEHFGAGSSAAGSNTVVIGQGSSAAANSSVVIGQGTTMTGGSLQNNVLIGQGASINGPVGSGREVVIGQGASDQSTGSGNVVVIGFSASARTSGVSSIAIGYGAQTGGDSSIAIGRSNVVASGNTGSIAIGGNLTTTASNQLLIGNTSIGSDIRNVYIGSGITNASPQALTIQATGGSGTDISAANFTIAGGQGTGAGTGGALIFSTAPTGTTGSSLNALAERMRIDGATGNVGIGTTSPYAKLSVAGTGVFQNIISTSTTDVNGIATSSPSLNYGFSIATSTYIYGNSSSVPLSIQINTVGQNDALRILNGNGSVTATLYGNGQINGSGLAASGAVTGETGFFTNNHASNNVLKVKGQASQTGDLFQALNSSSLVLGEITAAGGLGLGTTSPYAKLSVVGTVTDTFPVLFTVASSTGGTSTTTLFTIMNGGNVGIGTANPGATLNISTVANSTVGNGNGIYLTAGGKSAEIFPRIAGRIAFAPDTSVTTNFVDEYNSGSNLIYEFQAAGSAIFQGYNTPLVFQTAFTTQPISFGINSVEKMRIASNGNVGIGTTTPVSTLTVTGSACISQGGNTSVACSTTAGTITANVFNTAAADLAESYPTNDGSISAGDVVMADVNDTTPITIAKATKGSSIIGVISTSPGVLLGDSGDVTSNGVKLAVRAVALAGRVPIKVSMENGSIKKGDYLTLSSTPGVAMKATDSGDVIGTALESISNAGTITVFVRPGFANISNTDLNNFASSSAALAKISSLDIPGLFTQALASVGQWFGQRIVAIEGFFAHLTVGSAVNPDGITLYDKVTHQPYCFAMANGQAVETPGACGSTSTSQTQSASVEASQSSGDTSSQEASSTNDVIITVPTSEATSTSTDSTGSLQAPPAASEQISTSTPQAVIQPEASSTDSSTSPQATPVQAPVVEQPEVTPPTPDATPAPAPATDSGQATPPTDSTSTQ